MTNPPRVNKQSRRRLSLFLITALLLGAIVVSVLIRDHFSRAASAKGMTEALQNSWNGIVAYMDVDDRFPSAAIYDDQQKPLLSWRVIVKPYIMADKEAPRIFRDQSWDSSANQAARFGGKRNLYTSRYLDGQQEMTAVFGIVGPGTVFDAQPATLSEIPPDTIVLMGSEVSQTNWMKPEDVTLSEEGGIPLKDFLAMNADLGFFVYSRDSQILHLRADTPVELIRSFCKMQDANGRDRQQDLTKYVIE